jgi:hypothetical protein
MELELELELELGWSWSRWESARRCNMDLQRRLFLLFDFLLLSCHFSLFFFFFHKLFQKHNFRCTNIVLSCVGLFCLWFRHNVSFHFIFIFFCCSNNI